MNGSKALAAGIVGAIVPACIAPSQASAAVLYTQSDLINPAPVTRFVALVHQELHRPPVALLTWGTQALPSGHYSLDVNIESPPSFDSYTLIGLDPSGGVMVSFADPSIALGRSFTSVFPGMDEVQVADAILTGGPLLTAFMDVLDTTPGVGAPMGVECRVVHFSDGADNGTFIADFSPIPSPGAVLLISMAGTASVLRRRR